MLGVRNNKEMKNMKDAFFWHNASRVNRRSVDKLIELARSDREINHVKLNSSLNTREEEFNVDAFQSVYIEGPKVAFSLFSLAIVHCYSIVDNNRKQLCLRLPKLTEGQIRNLHDIRVASQCLKKVGITHKNIKCYKSMNEFRLVNNAIKHNRLNFTKTIVTENGKAYGSKQLNSLYSNKAVHLDTYLSELSRRVKKKTTSKA